MRIHVMSDIHFEFMRKKDGEEFFRLVAELNAKHPEDVLILAGDISQVSRHEAFAKAKMAQLAGYYKKVLYVPGNHEYFGSSFLEVDRFLETWDDDPNLANVIILQDGETYTYENQLFYGGTMWYPSGDENGAWDTYLKRDMRDFNVISGHEPEVYRRHQKFIDGLAKLPKGTVVISHHSCTPDSIHPQFKGSDINPFFCYDVRPHLNEGNMPKLWIHGHTHNHFDYMCGEMKVYCNPHGYSNEGENPQFFNLAVLDIPESAAVELKPSTSSKE